MDVVVDVDCVDIVNVDVNAAEMLMGLWEEWSFEKTWLTEWKSIYRVSQKKLYRFSNNQ